MPSRLITFANSAVQLEYEGAPAAQMIQFLYGAIPVAGQPLPHFTYRLLSNDDAPGRFWLYGGKALRYEGNDAAAAAELLLGDTCYHLADRSQGGLLFHAAGLAWQGRGVILPGTMGAGKTTLAAWLLSQGFDYLSDELVFIAHHQTTMSGLARPLNFKRAGRAAWRSLLPEDADLTGWLSSPATDLVSPLLFNPATTYSQPAPGLIIFPRYRPGAAFELQPLSKAQAGLELMQCLINARNLADHGLADIARLARLIPAYRLTYAGFAQLEPFWQDLAGALDEDLPVKPATFKM